MKWDTMWGSQAEAVVVMQMKQRSIVRPYARVVLMVSVLILWKNISESKALNYVCAI